MSALAPSTSEARRVGRHAMRSLVTAFSNTILPGWLPLMAACHPSGRPALGSRSSDAPGMSLAAPRGIQLTFSPVKRFS